MIKSFNKTKLDKSNLLIFLILLYYSSKCKLSNFINLDKHFPNY